MKRFLAWALVVCTFLCMALPAGAYDAASERAYLLTINLPGTDISAYTADGTVRVTGITVDVKSDGSVWYPDTDQYTMSSGMATETAKQETNDNSEIPVLPTSPREASKIPVIQLPVEKSGCEDFRSIVLPDSPKNPGERSSWNAMWDPDLGFRVFQQVMLADGSVGCWMFDRYSAGQVFTDEYRQFSLLTLMTPERVEWRIPDESYGGNGGLYRCWYDGTLHQDFYSEGCIVAKFEWRNGCYCRCDGGNAPPLTVAGRVVRGIF